MASTGKLLFCGGHWVKSINPWEKMKYVPERQSHIGAEYIIKLVTYRVYENKHKICAEVARVLKLHLWNSTFWLLYYSGCKKATSMVFIWGDKGYPAIRFEYKTASEQYLIAFGCFRKNSEHQFVQKTPKTVLLITQHPNIAQRLFCIQN